MTDPSPDSFRAWADLIAKIRAQRARSQALREQAVELRDELQHQEHERSGSFAIARRLMRDGGQGRD